MQGNEKLDAALVAQLAKDVGEQILDALVSATQRPQRCLACGRVIGGKSFKCNHTVKQGQTGSRNPPPQKYTENQTARFGRKNFNKYRKAGEYQRS